MLRKHVDLTDEYIERRFTKENRPIVSFFISKEEAERAIHKVLRDNASKIDEWLTKARTGTKTDIEGYISGSGAVVIKNSDRLRKNAQRIRVTIIKKEHNGMAYYVQTVKLD